MIWLVVPDLFAIAAPQPKPSDTSGGVPNCPAYVRLPKAPGPGPDTLRMGFSYRPGARVNRPVVPYVSDHNRVRLCRNFGGDKEKPERTVPGFLEAPILETGTRCDPEGGAVAWQTKRNSPVIGK